ncbi:MAG: hypothetical protein QOH97_1466 [Actinoplanes sp.]|nr:hypothetical protein [Actinoplanes sp.]
MTRSINDVTVVDGVPSGRMVTLSGSAVSGARGRDPEVVEHWHGEASLTVDGEHETRVGLLFAAAATAGATAVVEFLLPLWAGDRLGASPAVIGAIVAVQVLVALLVRPSVGRLTDRGGRGLPAASAGIVIAIAMVLYSTADGYVPVFAGAALAGLGSALFWVPVQTHIADLGGSAQAYGRLFAFQTRGSLIGFVCAFTLLARTGYSTVFLCAAGAVTVAALLVISAHLPPGRHRGTTSVAGLNRRLLPVTLLVGVTSLAQTGLGLILLLHLQRHFGLQPAQIGLVLGPGAIMLALAGGRTHRLTERLGRQTTLMIATASTGVMAVVLAFAANTVIVTVAWAIAAASIAASVPVEQAAIAALSGDGGGQGFSVYGAAAMVGAFLGPAMFGVLYGVAGSRPASSQRRW